MTDQDKISRIIELQSIITQRIITDRSYHPCDGDEYHEHRQELSKLRKEVSHIINTPSYLDGPDPQRPDYERVKRCKEEISKNNQKEDQEI